MKFGTGIGMFGKLINSHDLLYPAHASFITSIFHYFSNRAQVFTTLTNWFVPCYSMCRQFSLILIVRQKEKTKLVIKLTMMQSEVMSLKLINGVSIIFVSISASYPGWDHLLQNGKEPLKGADLFSTQIQCGRECVSIKKGELRGRFHCICVPSKFIRVQRRETGSF